MFPVQRCYSMMVHRVKMDLYYIFLVFEMLFSLLVSAHEFGIKCGVLHMPSNSDEVKAVNYMVDIDEFPWAAILFYHEDYQGCEGVLISNTFVLTAARCLVGKSYDKVGPLEYVRLGEYNIFSDPDCVIHTDGKYMDCNDGKIDARPKSIKVHPDYISDSVQQYHDMGLIELDRAIRFTFYLRPISLPEPTFQSDPDSSHKYTVCSWGRTHFFQNELSQKTPIKLKAYPHYVEPQVCEDSYRDEQLSLGPGQFCAGENHRHYLCAGDSGSPLMFFDQNKNSWVLSGIVSRDPGICGDENKPGIYTNVKYYLPWIKANAQL